MLDTIRDYAREQLAPAEREAVEGRHAAYYLTLAEQAAEGIHGPEHVAWLDCLQREQGNLRAAFGWGYARGAAELCLRLATARGQFWSRRGQLSEGIATFDAALALPDAAPAVRAQALLAASEMIWPVDTTARGLTYQAEALALCEAIGDQRGIAKALIFLDEPDEALTRFVELGDKRGMAHAHYRLGTGAWQIDGDVAAAISHLQQALALYEELGDQAQRPLVLGQMASVARDQEDYARADRLFRTCLAQLEQDGDTNRVAGSLVGVAELAMLQGDYAAAHEYLIHSLDLSRRQGNEDAVPNLLYNLGYVVQHLGDEATMAACMRESLRAMWLSNYFNWYGDGVAGVGAVAGMRGEYARAARLFGAAETLREAAPFHGYLARIREIERNIALVRAQLDDATWRAAWAAGRALTVEQAMAEAMATATEFCTSD